MAVSEIEALRTAEYPDQWGHPGLSLWQVLEGSLPAGAHSLALGACWSDCQAADAAAGTPAAAMGQTE